MRCWVYTTHSSPYVHKACHALPRQRVLSETINPKRYISYLFNFSICLFYGAFIWLQLLNVLLRQCAVKDIRQQTHHTKSHSPSVSFQFGGRILSHMLWFFLISSLTNDCNFDLILKNVVYLCICLYLPSTSSSSSPSAATFVSIRIDRISFTRRMKCLQLIIGWKMISAAHLFASDRMMFVEDFRSVVHWRERIIGGKAIVNE